MGTPNTPYWSTHSVCSASSVLSGRPLHASSATASASSPADATASFSTSSSASCFPCSCRAGEQCEVRVEELVGERVAHGDAVQQRPHPGAPLLGIALPHRRLALTDVHLIERERHEAEIDVVSAADRVDDGEVAVVGEGAAVVEGDGDGAGHGGTSRVWRRIRGYCTTSQSTVGWSVGSETTRRPSVDATYSRPARGRGRARSTTISPSARLAGSRKLQAEQSVAPDAERAGCGERGARARCRVARARVKQPSASGVRSTRRDDSTRATLLTGTTRVGTDEEIETRERGEPIGRRRFVERRQLPVVIHLHDLIDRHLRLECVRAVACSRNFRPSRTSSAVASTAPRSLSLPGRARSV